MEIEFSMGNVVDEKLLNGNKEAILPNTKVKCVYIDIEQPFYNYEKYIPYISENRRKKIELLRFEKDKIICLLTEMFVKNEISKKLLIPFHEIEFGYGQHGKPFLLNNKNYHFSVSHAGNYISFIDGNLPVGIDIEQISSGNIKIAKEFFTSKECDYINNHIDCERAFLNVWTRKEAYVKMLGVGMVKSFSSFDVLNDNLYCDFFTCSLEQYVVSVCYLNRVNDRKILVETLPFENIIFDFL